MILNGEIRVLVGTGCPKGRSERQRRGGGVGIWLGHRWGLQGHVKKGARKNRNSEDL